MACCALIFEADVATRLVGSDAAQHLFNHATAVAYGGFFAAQREEIERYPVELFEAIAAQQKAPNEEVDHFIERLWGILFSVPSVPPRMTIKPSAALQNHKGKGGGGGGGVAAAFFEAPPEGTKLVNHNT